MLHAACGARLPAEALLGCLVADKSLAEDFERYRTIDQEMRSAIDCAHPSASQAFIQAIFALKYSAKERINWRFGDGGVGLQQCVIERTDCLVIRELTATSWALEHIRLTKFRESALLIIAQK
jgi:hypothetical protein